MINYDTSLLYGLSAIPQVLAALIAFVGVFLLFKFQSLNSTIISFGEQTVDFFVRQPFLVNCINKELQLFLERLNHGIIRKDSETVASQVTGIIAALKTTKISFSLDDQSNREEKNILFTIEHNNKIQFDCLSIRDGLKKRFKYLLINSGIVIISSILCLPLVPLFSECGKTNIMIIFFLVLTLWLLYCIVEIYRMIQFSFKRDY